MCVEQLFFCLISCDSIFGFLFLDVGAHDIILILRLIKDKSEAKLDIAVTNDVKVESKIVCTHDLGR